MYERFFGFTAKPFTTLPDPAFLVGTETHREALAALLYGVQERKGFIVLTGEVGTGKTLMVRTMLDRLGPDVISAYVTNPRVDLLGLFSYIFAEFGIPERPKSKGEAVLVLNRWLIDRLMEGKTPVLVVDEAQSFTRDMLEEVRLLTNLETPTEKLLHVILVGQPELDVTLADRSLRQLVQRITVRCRLRPLSKDEVKMYVRSRLARVGGTNGPIFTDRAIRRLYKHGRGVPRITNALCDTALMIAYGGGQREVNHRTLAEAARLVAATGH